MARNNIAIRSSNEVSCLARTRDIDLSNDLSKRVDGELLGDGSLEATKFQAYFSFSNSKEDYVRWIHQILIENNIPTSKFSTIRQYDGRTDKTYTRFNIRTKCSIQFRELYEKWYINRIKRVPEDIVLHRETLLHWWLGDGMIGNRCGFLCTDAFAYDEVGLLSNKMNDLLNIESRVRPRKNPSGKIAHRIYIPRVGMKKLLDFIGPSPISSLKHRWRIS